jgi:amidophosphoribosyltransferase
MPTRQELIAARSTTEEIRREIGADELYYLSLEGLKEALREMKLNPDDFCFACFNGEYKIPLRGNIKTK